MRGKKAKAIRKKFRLAGIPINTDHVVFYNTGAVAPKGRRQYQLVKRGLAVLDG